MSSFGDIRQRVGLQIDATGADTVSILAQATRELQADFKKMVVGFDAGKVTANEMIAELGRMATALNKVGEIASADADRMAKATAATEAFIDKANAALAKKDGQEAKADAEAQKRLEAKQARDQATLDAIGAAADKAAKAANKAADDIARAAQKEADATARASQKRQAEIMQAILDEDRRAKAIQAGADQIIAANQKEVAAQRAKEDADLKAYNNSTQTTAATREQIQALKDMGIIQDSVTAKVSTGKGQFGGFATAAEQAADKTKRFGYAAMNASYLVQDMQYGIGAVANNIGLMTQSLSNAFPGLDSFITKIGVPGGATGLGAGIMFAAVAFDVAYKNWDTIKGALGQGVPAKMLGDIKELNDGLDELKNKKIKTSIDYADIRIAQKETERLTELESAYQRLKSGKTEAQQKQSSAVSEAIIEEGGTGDYSTGVENVSAAVQQVRGVTKSATLIQLEQQYAKAKELESESAKAGLDSQGYTDEAAEVAKQIEIQKAADEENRAKQARDIVSGAASGNVASLRELRRLHAANPQAFKDRGVSDKFGALLGEATPEGAKRKEQVDEDYDEANREGDFSIHEIKKRSAERRAREKKAGVKTRRDDKAQAAKDNEVREAEEAAAAIANDVDKWFARQGKRSEKDEEKHTGDMKTTARRMGHLTDTGAENFFGQQFQQFSGGLANPLQSQKAGKEIYSRAKEGVNPNVAAAEALRKLIDELRQLGQINQQQQAALFQQAGMLEQAAQVVRQINTKANMLGRNQGRAATGRPTQLPSYSGF